MSPTSSTRMDKFLGSPIWSRLNGRLEWKKQCGRPLWFCVQSKGLKLPFWSRSIKGIEWKRLWMKVEEHMTAFLVLACPNLFYACSEVINFLLLQPSESSVTRVKNVLSEVLKNVLLLHTQIQKVRASSGALEVLLANVESVTTALAEEKVWSGVESALKSCAFVEYLWELSKKINLDRMRSELDLLPTGEDDPWEQFEDEAQVYAVVVSAVALLSLVYHYLAGHIDRGGTKTYSPGSLEFRSTYVSIVLFQGAYVWIKFRDVPSAEKGGYRRPVTDKLSRVTKRSGKPEARFYPPRKSGNDDYIYLGVCATDEEAKVKNRIAAFYYGRNIGRLDFGDGRYFLIPPMSEELEQGLSVEEKRKWVRKNVSGLTDDIKAFVDFNTVHLVEQIHAPRSSSLPTSDVAIRPEVIVAQGDLPLSEEDATGFAEFLETFLDSASGTPDVPDAEPQHHLQDNHVQDRAMAMPTFLNQCDDSEPLGTGGSESILNHVHGSSEVAAGGLTNEDAPCNPQAVNEFLETFFDSSEGTPDLPDAEFQHHLQDNHVQDWVMAMLTFDNQCDNSLPLGTGGSESILNHVHGSSEVAAGGLTNEDAPYNPQAVSEVPTMSSDGLQRHSDAEAVMSDMAIPSASNLCPWNSTSDLLVLKHLEQSLKAKDKRIVELEREKERQIEEKDKRIVELEHEKERQIEEKDKRIVELELEIERLRGASQY